MKVFIISSKPFDENYIYNILKVYDITTTSLLGKADFILAIGGDAAVLRVLGYNLENILIPILAYNTGALGFLSSNKPFDELLKSFISGVCRPDRRSILDINYKGIDYSLNALNEVAVVPVESGRMVTAELYINDNFVTTYKGDGLIVSTPTGSTAWNLSCGGPIVDPSVKCIIITPSNPFSINHRPIVVNHNSRITIKGIDKIVVDGRDCYYTSTVTIKRGMDSPIELVDTEPKVSFFDRIKSKLGWSKNIKGE